MLPIRRQQYTPRNRLRFSNLILPTNRTSQRTFHTFKLNKMTNRELIETAKQAMSDLLSTSQGKMLEHEQSAYNCLRLFCERIESQECEVACGENYCDENGCVQRKRILTNPIEDDEQFDEDEPCHTCGDINGMINPCCSGYDALHYKNCGYG